MIIYPFLGRNFFPEVDAGQIRLHVRGPTGFRVEDTAGLVDRVEAAVRQVIPPQEIGSLVDNIGLAGLQHQRHLQHLRHRRQLRRGRADRR